MKEAKYERHVIWFNVLTVKKKKRHNHRAWKQISGCLGIGWRLITNGHERIFRTDRNVTNWIVSTSGYVAKRIKVAA